jgi:hypothetical protein
LGLHEYRKALEQNNAVCGFNNKDQESISDENCAFCSRVQYFVQKGENPTSQSDSTELAEVLHRGPILSAQQNINQGRAKA